MFDKSLNEFFSVQLASASYEKNKKTLTSMLMEVM